MENSLLAGILKALTPAEQRRLKKWVRSPAHNQRQDCIDLLEYLLENDRLHKPHLLDKERLFQRLFPNEPYEDARLRQTIHFLTKTVEGFLIQEELYHSPIEPQILLLRSFRKRGLEKGFRKTYRQAQGLLKKFPFENETYLDYHYNLLLEYYIQYEQPKRTKEVRNLQELSDGLDQKYIAQKLRQSCLMQSHKNIIKSDYHAGLQQDVLDYVAQNQLYEVPVIGMYYYLLRAFEEGDNEHWFQKILHEIDLHSSLFPKEEITDVYKLTLNYCIRRVNNNPQKYLPISFDLYKRGLRDDIFVEEGQISPFTFNNIFRSALLLNKLDWAEDFIDRYATFLREDHRDAIVHYSKARVYYEKKQYKDSMRLLVQSNFDDINLQLSVKVLLAKIYYELDEHDALESLLESLKVFLRRKEILGYHRTIFQHFTRFTKKLVRINPYDASQVRQLKAEIENAPPFGERSWLLDQVNDL